MRLLKNGGRAGLVLPDSILFGDGVKERIKRTLLEQCNLHTIIRLPKSVFAPYTSIATNLLFFTKGSPTKNIWFYEHKLPPKVKAYNKTKPININEFDTLKSWWGNEENGFISRVENENAWNLSIDEIKDLNFNLDVKNPNTFDNKLDQDPKILLDKFKSLEKEKNAIREQIHKFLLDCFD